MFVLELPIHSEDHMLQPIALALEPESANDRKKKPMTEDHKHCLFGLANRMCSVVLFTVA